MFLEQRQLKVHSWTEINSMVRVDFKSGIVGEWRVICRAWKVCCLLIKLIHRSTTTNVQQFTKKTMNQFRIGFKKDWSTILESLFQKSKFPTKILEAKLVNNETFLTWSTFVRPHTEERFFLSVFVCFRFFVYFRFFFRDRMTERRSKNCVCLEIWNRK